ncbi:hypothetical protein AB4156_10170 [Cupriavidus sp. 2MCAB6]|uniref:hypothetical protein n=1 Tax=Cupriavidus sp. 2MCAB6 TaxID=3232981 RepID=UPI003F8F9003
MRFRRDELGRLGQKAGIRVEYRRQENIAVKSPTALVAGLMRPKATFRQRNLYCQFELSELPATELKSLETKASSIVVCMPSGSFMPIERSEASCHLGFGRPIGENIVAQP